MLNVLDLKQIEREAFRSTYQDGLMDIFWGAIVAAMAITINRPESGYSPMNIIWMVLIYTVGGSLFWAGKKYITLPRMGQVRFGAIRQHKNKTLAIILGIVVLIQVFVVGVTVLGWLSPDFGQILFGINRLEHLAVAALGSLFVGPPMLVIAYMIDFSRGYYIAVLMALSVFLMIYFNQPIYPLIISGLIIIPGLVLLIQFLKKYPIRQGDEPNG